MLELIIKALTFFVMPIAGFFIIRNISEEKVKILSKRTILMLIVLIVVNFLIYNVEYKIIITILNFCAMVICYKFIFKTDLFSSLIKSIFLMLFVAISEIFTYIFIIEPIFNKWQLRSVGLSSLLANLVVALIAIVLSKIKIFKKLSNAIANKIEKSDKVQMTLMVILWLFVITFLCYLIFTSLANSFSLWVSVFVEGLFILFLINYFRDKNTLSLLNEKFDTLYDYVQTMEEYLDNEQLNIHEYKNQLSVIKSMSSNKKINKYIDSIIVDSVSEFSEWNSDLKNLPKGGLKGLLHYKLAIAQSKSLDIFVNISKDIHDYLNDLSLDELKNISRVIGIYLDNAIEAAENTVSKKLCLEIYTSTVGLEIVISNSISEKPDLLKIKKKGFSTKSKNRGKGLYLANKIISNNSISVSTKIINNYFVQKIIIK